MVLARDELNVALSTSYNSYDSARSGFLILRNSTYYRVAVVSTDVVELQTLLTLWYFPKCE